MISFKKRWIAENFAILLIVAFQNSLAVDKAVAVATTWSDTASTSDWFDATNWLRTPVGYPVTGDTVYIGNTTPNGAATTGVVTIGSPGAQATQIYLGYAVGTTGTLTVVGPAADLTTSGSFTVGTQGTGHLQITNGGVLNTSTTSTSSNVIIGYQSSASQPSTVLIDGAGSVWNAYSSVIIGGRGAGSGEMTVQNGGVLNLTNALGSNTNSGLGLGDYTGATGTLTITGPGSKVITTPGITVGIQGTGTVSILNAGTLESGADLVDYDYIGYVAASNSVSPAEGHVVVDGQGSSWINHTGIVVGYTGIGTLTISNGATVTSGYDSYIGLNAITGAPYAAHGEVLITGLGSRWTTESLEMAALNGADGILTVADGGVLKVTGDPNGDYIRMGAGGNAVINIGAPAGQPAVTPGTIEAGSIEMLNGVASQINFNHTATEADNYTFAPSMFGDGTINVLSGVTTLTGTNTYSGPTTIFDGATLKAGATSAFSPNSDFVVKSGGTLNVNGISQTVQSLSNAGTVNMGTGTPPPTLLTVGRNYLGQGGVIRLNTVLDDDNSPTDKMVVQGNVSGQTTALDVRQAGGTGKITINGIQIIEVGGTSSADAFTLANGKPSIPVGAYEYVLQKGGTVTGGDSWYLASTVNPNPPPVNPPPVNPPPVNPPPVNPPPVNPPPVNPSTPSNPPVSRPSELQPIYRPGATSYVAAQFLNAGQGFQQLYTLHQRVGEHRGLPEEKQTWARTSYLTSTEEGKTRFGYDQDTLSLQIGQELMARRIEQATQRAALAFDYSHTDANFTDRIRPLVGLNEKTGEGEAEAWAFEGYFTQIYDGGAYFDIVGQVAALKNEYAIFESDGGRYKADQNGWRTGISGEAGYPVWQSGKWTLEGQGQLSYQYASYGDFEDKAGNISDADAHSLRGRLGTRLARQLAKKEKQSFEVYGVVNLVADLIQPGGVDVDNNGNVVRISEDYDPLYGEIGAGLQGYVTGKISLFTDFRYQRGFNTDNNRHGCAINVGLRIGL